jgi:hypothetical protein
MLLWRFHCKSHSVCIIYLRHHPVCVYATAQLNHGRKWLDHVRHMICESLDYTKMGISSTSFLEKTVNSHLFYIVLDLENEIVLLSACLSWCCSLLVHTSFSIAGHFHCFSTKYLFVFLCHFSLFTVFAHPCAKVRWPYQSVDVSKITWKLSLKTTSSFEFGKLNLPPKKKCWMK